jgi:hypothetical protein
MDRRFAAGLLVASIHLAIVACGAAGLRISRVGGPILSWYGAMSASEMRFSFYAPRVPAFPEVTFEMVAADGRRWTDTLERGHNEEADLRLTASAFRFEEGGSVLAASYATALFARHPEAMRITVQVARFDPPPMAAWREGARGEAHVVFRETFDRPGVR